MADHFLCHLPGLNSLGFGFESKENDELTEDEKIALLGKPKLGTAPRSQIRIKENKEYKVRTTKNTR